MKRSLEKKRAAIRRPPARDERESIPVNAAAIDMGSSWCQPPASWRTHRRNCDSCAQGFTVTAAEQQHWYETLRIPVIVGICYCPTCRKGRRAQRRIISRLAELSPLVAEPRADERELREYVLVVAEGTVRRIRPRFGSDDWVLRGEGILLRGCEAIKRLLRSRRSQRDLLPILVHFHERLGNAERARRLVREIETIRKDDPKTAKAIEAVESWLRSPTKQQLADIIEPQR